MKISMRIVGVSAIALALCGCGGSEKKAAEYSPKVADGAALAVGFNQKQIKAVQERLLGEKAKEVSSSLMKNAPEEVSDVIKKAGLEDAEVRWGVVTVGEPKLKEDMDLDGVPEVMVAVSLDIDIEKVVAAFREQLKKEDGEELKETTVAGVKAWIASDKDLEKQKVSPTFTALDGKLFLAASTTASLEKLVALYRDGKGQSAAFSSFGLPADSLLRLVITDIGARVKKAIPYPEKTLKIVSQFVPNGDKMILALGALDFSATSAKDGGVALKLTLKTGSEKDADQLRTLAKTGLMPFTAQMKEAAKEDAESKVYAELLEALKIAGAEGVFEANLAVPQAVLKSLAEKQLKELGDK